MVSNIDQFRPWAALLLGFLLAAPLRAQTAGDIDAAARQGDIIQRQQLDRLREDMEKARKAPGPAGGTDLRDLKPSVAAPDLGAACRKIVEIQVAGADHLPPAVVSERTRPFLDRCLGVAEVEAVLGELTRAYIERGLVTARAYLPAQDLSGGILRIQVIEGRIEGYRIDGEGSGIFVPGAFPAAPGELLNLRDLEQGIDQINRLASNNAQLDIQPGSRPGSSLVVVRNRRSFPAHLQLSLDNLGTDSTGNYGTAASLTVDSPLGINERFLFSHRDTWSAEHSDHHSQSDAFEFWVPFGYSALTLGISRSNYVNALAVASGDSLRSEGNTETASLGVDRVVFRDQDSRTSLSLRLTTQESKNYLEQQLLQTSSRKLTYLEAGASSFAALAGGMFSGQLGYAQGIKALGAQVDAAGLDDSVPRAQFRKLSLDLSYNRNFRLFDRDFSWSSQWSGLYGLTSLYGSQQMLIGGHSSVRGFVNTTLSGDRGYFWRNELAIPYRLALFGKPLAGRAYAAYDFGAVRSIASGTASGRLSGAALGVNLQLAGLALEISCTSPLDMPAGMVREPVQAWFRLSSSL